MMSLRYSLIPLELQKERKVPLSSSSSLPSHCINSQGQRLDMIIKWLSDPLRKILLSTKGIPFAELEEIRLRRARPLLLLGKDREYFLDPQGEIVSIEKAYHVQQDDLLQTLERMTQSSLYAAEEELKQGFFTLPGGHRVGVSGEAVFNQGKLKSLKHISSLNFRLAHEISGKAVQILPFLIRPDGSLFHTLILSPPRAGKTTLLRDLIRCLSEGVDEIPLKGRTVGVVDERGELAGMWQGNPTYNLGYRTDVLDRCTKALGITMLIRSMSPQVIAVDELGHSQDVEAIMDALRTGVSVLSTAHAENWAEAKERPVLKELFASGIFERLVLLSRRKGPGTIDSIVDLRNKTELL